MVEPTLDKGLANLRNGIAERSQVPLASIGWIAGASHRQSGPHFPQSPPPPGNPDKQVDAIDVPHRPDLGVDCHVLCEDLRTNPENRRRLRHMIFDGRQCSSYWMDGIAPWTWRPYSGEDMHRGHAHVEAADDPHDVTAPWIYRLMEDELNAQQAAMLSALYHVVCGLGGDRLSAGDAVPEEDRLPGKISVPGAASPIDRTKGNTLVEQVRSMRRMMFAALTGIEGLEVGEPDAEDIEILADSIVAKLGPEFAGQLAAALNMRFSPVQLATQQQ